MANEPPTREVFYFRMDQTLQNIRNEAVAQIMGAGDAGELETIRIDYLGRSGKLAEVSKGLKNLGPDERKGAGLLLNDTKQHITKLLAQKKADLKSSVREWFDPTIPGEQPNLGNLHLVTQAIEEIANVFEKIGFTRVRYPEVEWDWYAFGALNFPPNHPARDNWETFFVDTKPSPKYGPMVLTPHTSSGQIREMETSKPPIRMINIAKCYRRQSDASHTQMFHQFEGLVVDEGISITNLKGTLDYFAKAYFGPDRRVRLRPHNFNFTEPSFEIDVSCDICGGTGCKVCKEGWLELLGAGMVHPNVLANCGIDPAKYTGFAFGAGVERSLMMKSGLKVPDLRLIYSPTLAFLRQF